MTKARSLFSSKKWLSLGAVAAVSLALLAASACGGGDEESTTNGQGTPAASVAGSPAPSGASGKTTPAPASGSSGQTSGDASKKLKDLGGQWAKSSGKVTYDMTTKTGQGSQTSTAVMYWAPSRFRMDLETDLGGTKTKMALISTSDKTYICIPAPTQLCMVSEGASGAASLGLPELTDAAAVEKAVNDFAGSGGIDTSSQKIAGKDASCFSAKTGKWCFSSDGLLLLANVNDASGNVTFSLQAREVGKLSDDDFNPPYPISQLPGGLPSR